MAKLGSINKITDNLSSVEKKIAEYLLKENLSSSALKKRFQDYYSKIELPTVQYKDGTDASPMILQWLLTVHEKIDYDETVPSFKKAEICTKANEVLKELDSTSFQAVLRDLAEKNLGLTGKSKNLKTLSAEDPEVLTAGRRPISRTHYSAVLQSFWYGSREILPLH